MSSPTKMPPKQFPVRNNTGDLIGFSVHKVTSLDTECCNRKFHCLHIALEKRECYYCEANIDHNHCKCHMCNGEPYMKRVLVKNVVRKAVKEATKASFVKATMAPPVTPPVITKEAATTKQSSFVLTSRRERREAITKSNPESKVIVQSMYECLSKLLDGKSYYRNDIFPNVTPTTAKVSSQKDCETKILKMLVADGALQVTEAPPAHNPNSAIIANVYSLKNETLFFSLMNDMDYLYSLVWPSGKTTKVSKPYAFFPTAVAVSKKSRQTVPEAPTVDDSPSEPLIVDAQKFEQTQTVSKDDDVIAMSFGMPLPELLSNTLRVVKMIGDSQVDLKATVDKLTKEVVDLRKRLDELTPKTQ